MGIRQSSRPPRQIFDPNHPDANPNGYVSLPDINVIEEMVDLLSAVRSYEANLTAYNATKSLVRPRMPTMSDIFASDINTIARSVIAIMTSISENPA